MTRSSRTPSRKRRMLPRTVAGTALAVALLLPGGAAFAASSDDTAPSPGSMVIEVVIPARTVNPGDTTPDDPATGEPGAGGGQLPRTGLDAASLWPLALVGLAATVAGAGLVAARGRPRGT